MGDFTRKESRLKTVTTKRYPPTEGGHFRKQKISFFLIFYLDKDKYIMYIMYIKKPKKRINK